MKKHSVDPSTPIEKSHLAESLEEHPLFQWISENGKILLYALAALLLGLFVIYQFSATSRSKAENDYFQAATEFRIFQQASGKEDVAAQNEAFERLEKILQRLPDLHPKYDGLIAQVFLNRNEIAKAEEFAAPALKRTSEENQPYYIAFAETTLLLGKGEYEDALSRSIDLKQKMLERATQTLEERGFDDQLFALNLLRIALLQQKTNHPQEELKTWEEWKQYAGLNNEGKALPGIDSTAFQNLLTVYDAGKVSLLSYIEAREKILNN
jgi:predicted negative regulator of RcsB-dependent stress response